MNLPPSFRTAIALPLGIGWCVIVLWIDSRTTAEAVGRKLRIDEVIAEVAATRITERGQTRADDRTSEAAMEDRKREGYF